jgi:hypothetical protein
MQLGISLLEIYDMVCFVEMTIKEAGRPVIFLPGFYSCAPGFSSG